jgi:dihydroorotase
MTRRPAIRRPDDRHLSVWDHETMRAPLPRTARQSGRATLGPGLAAPGPIRAAGPEEGAPIGRGGEAIPWRVVAE